VLDPVSGQPLPLQGWSQEVRVWKVNPYSYAEVAWEQVELPDGNFLGRALDRYPLRVTVSVLYQGPYDTTPQQVVAVSWIVPDNQ
jgi:hypothetical protein